jgi:3-hydroxyisobutyrate dehydrogenase-like beta-hydroxyacid dehydrogenase
MHKDISLARSTANRPLPALDCLLEALRSAEAKGYGDEDFLALIRNLNTPDAP